MDGYINKILTTVSIDTYIFFIYGLYTIIRQVTVFAASARSAPASAALRARIGRVLLHYVCSDTTIYSYIFVCLFFLVIQCA